MTLSQLTTLYPLRAKVKASNPYNLPQGTDLPLVRRKEGDASPYPIEAFEHLERGRLYQFREDEVDLFVRGFLTPPFPDRPPLPKP